MLPGLVIIDVAGERRIWIPLPVFLLWPLWGLGWLLWLLMRLIRIPGRRRLWLFLALSGRLSGARLGIRSAAGPHVRVRMI